MTQKYRKVRTNLLLTVLGATMLLQMVSASSKQPELKLGTWYALTSLPKDGTHKKEFVETFNVKSLIKLVDIKGAGNSSTETQYFFEDADGNKAWISGESDIESCCVPSFPECWWAECTAFLEFMQSNNTHKGSNSEALLPRFQIGDWVKATARSGVGSKKFSKDYCGEVIGFRLLDGASTNKDKKIGRVEYKIKWSHKKSSKGILEKMSEQTKYIKASNWKKLVKVDEDEKKEIEKLRGDQRRRLLPMERLLRDIKRAQRTA